MAVKWVEVVAVCAVVLGACGGDDATAPPAASPTEASASATPDAPATTSAPVTTATASTSALTTATPTTATPTTVMPEPATALAVIDALAAAGLPIGTTVEYTDITDPNNNLGRPGKYIAKAAWIDTRVDCALDEPGWDCGGDVELFDDPADLENRWNYLIGFADAPLIGGYYMWRSDTAIIRVGFVIAPSLAYEYQAALGAILGGVEAFEELAVPATTTTVAATTTVPTGTAPVRTSGLTDAEFARLVFYASWTGEVRDIIIDRLPDVPDVETVERVDFDPDTDTVIIAVTSVWRTRDRQIDTAWKLTEIHSALWKEGGANDGSDWSAALRVTSSAVTFECSGEFMVRLATDSASRADWLDECSV